MAMAYKTHSPQMICAAAALLFLVGIVACTTAMDVSKEALSVRDKSIAVLPFRNLNGDPAQEYFSDGISEDILSGLAGIPELHVIGRTSSFSYRGKTVTLNQLRQELGVKYILEGSVESISARTGRMIEVKAQLIETTKGKHVWAYTCNRELGDIFSVQDQITEEVVTYVRSVIMGEGIAALMAVKDGIDGVWGPANAMAR